MTLRLFPAIFTLLKKKKLYFNVKRVSIGLKFYSRQKMRAIKAGKPFDYVAHMNYMNEISRKNKITDLNWRKQYQWLCDEYKNVHEEMKKLCEEESICDKKPTDDENDDRSVKPFPQTANALYGWLAAKNEFILENPASFIVKYPNPLDEVTLLTGAIPMLAAGKGFL